MSANPLLMVGDGGGGGLGTRLINCMVEFAMVRSFSFLTFLTLFHYFPIAPWQFVMLSGNFYFWQPQSLCAGLHSKYLSVGDPLPTLSDVSYWGEPE